jgi:Phosphate-induced protein 1 conserved region
MKRPIGKVLLVFVFALLAVNFLAAQQVIPGAQGVDRAPDGRGGADSNIFLPAAKPIGDTVVTGNGINYHTGGTILAGNPVPIYIIWYGNWTNGPKASDTLVTRTLIESFLSSSSLGGSSYEAINTTYGDPTHNVSGHLNFTKSILDNYSHGTRFNDSGLQSIVSGHLTNGDLPTDAGGVYVVLTSSDVNETSGFCRTYCGFHTHATLNGADIKYAFVGNVDKCQSGCEIQSTGPNSPGIGVGGADGIANVLTHETEETITDPDLNAWFDSSGQEDADKCNFKFGPTTVCASGSLCTSAAISAGAKFNQSFGSHVWMIQMEWENSRGGGCDQTLGGPFFTN